MPARKKASKTVKNSSANLGFEAKLWLAADKLRNNMDAALGKNGGQWSGATWTLPKERPKGERGGVHQFYTPSCVVRCLVEMLAPYKGRNYDPACGSGGMFMQTEKFVESHGGKLGDISIYGLQRQDSSQRFYWN